MQKFKVLIICGTRPEAIKLSPLIKELSKNKKIKTHICLTNQHKKLYEKVFQIFKLNKSIFFELNLQKHKSLPELTSKLILKLNNNNKIKKEKYNLVIVHGDTTSALCGAFYAMYNKIPLCHIESGLRTHKKYFPFPEELNRKFIDSISDLHFCPTDKNLNNLKKENINTKNSYVVGNTVIDVFKEIKLSKIKKNQKKIILVTLHRREIWGESFEKILDALITATGRHDEYEIHYVLNENPILQKIVKNKFKNKKNFKIIHSMNVDKFHDLINQSFVVVSDSGGLQEECCWLEKPIFILRNETERPELLENKSGFLLTTNPDDIRRLLGSFLKFQNKYFKKNKYLFGKGDSSIQIVKHIINYLEREIK
jgi:UDP-N-acetylglucosamine 2-epimerase (non-hydrolysing)